jgi:uncharacterized protein YjbJ (UPF0337 family)
MKSSNQDKLEGTAKKISGSVKESAGKLTGDDRLRSEGRAEQAKGQTQKKIGEIKKVLGS